MVAATPAGATPPAPTVTLLLFASARDAAGRSHDAFSGASVDVVLADACARYGLRFEEILEHCRVWVNGEPAEPAHPLRVGDEVAVLPPVSGG